MKHLPVTTLYSIAHMVLLSSQNLSQVVYEGIQTNAPKLAVTLIASLVPSENR